MISKLTKNLKKIFVLFFAFGFASNFVYAAIVSDNDSSTFITKAEFEVFKAGFNKQVDNYNANVDEKIDGAIDTYLANMNILVEPENYWAKLTEKLGGNTLVFKNKFKEISSGTITTEVNLSITRDLVAKGEWGLTCGRRFFESGYRYRSGDSSSKVSGTVWLMGIGGTNAGDYVETDINNRLLEYRCTDTDHTESQGTIEQYETNLNGPNTRNWTTALSRCVFTKKANIQSSQTKTIDGSGKAWVYRRAANGNIYLKEYADLWPILNIDVWRHDYKDYSFSNDTTFRNYYFQDNGKALTGTINLTATEHHEYGAWTQGTKYEGEDENSGSYLSCNVIQMKANDGVDYSTYQYGSDLTNNIYCIRDSAALVAETTTSSYTATNMTWTADYFNQLGKRKQTNNFNNVQLTYTNVKQITESLDPSTISNEYITNIAGENVFLGGGAPLIYALDDGQVIKLKMRFSSTGPSTDTVHYCVTDKQFVKGAVATGAKVFGEGNAQVGNEVEVTITSENKKLYWINMYSNTSGADCTMSSMTMTVQ